MHGAKRAAYAPGAAGDAGASTARNGSAHGTAHAGGRDRGTRPADYHRHSHAFGAAFGRGGAGASTASAYKDADLGYWDKENHFRTQHSVEQHIRRNSGRSEHDFEPARPSDPVINFLVVSGVLGLAVGIPALYLESAGASSGK